MINILENESTVDLVAGSIDSHTYSALLNLDENASGKRFYFYILW